MVAVLPPEGRTWSRARRIAFPASLVLNIFLVALIGGHELKRRVDGGERQTIVATALEHAEASLPPDDAKAFHDVVYRDASRFDDAARRLSDARRNVKRAIEAQPFDKAALTDALTVWREQLNAFFGDFSATLADALAKVSPEGRRRLVADRESQEAARP